MSLSFCSSTPLRTLCFIFLPGTHTFFLDDLCMLGELLSGQRVYQEDLENLTTEEWLTRWRTFQERQPHFWKSAASR